MLMYLFCALIFKILLPQENVVSGGLVTSQRASKFQCFEILSIQPYFSSQKERKRKKERKSLWPNTHIKYTKRFVGLSKYDYIRKMLNKNHLGKIPSKAKHDMPIYGRKQSFHLSPFNFQHIAALLGALSVQFVFGIFIISLHSFNLS